MRKLVISIGFITLTGCISMHVEGNLGGISNPGLLEEIELHGYPAPGQLSQGFAFGLGGFYPKKFFLRAKFAQNFQKANKNGLKTHYQTQEGWLEGGLPLYAGSFIEIYPVIGIGAGIHEVYLNRYFRGETFMGLLGFETQFVLTREKPGYLALFLRGNVMRIGGTYLDTKYLDDFLLSPPHFMWTLSTGVVMGYIFD